MSHSETLARLLERAANVEKAMTLDLTDAATSKQDAANNRALLRATIWNYLGALDSHLLQLGLPKAVTMPLKIIADQIHALEVARAHAPLFDTGGKPFRMTKSSWQRRAEGYAVGCAAYLHEVIGDNLTDACCAVASMFTHLGHEGRIKERLHDPDHEPRLTGKTVYQWHGELGAKARGSRKLTDDVGLAFGRYAKQEAFDYLVGADEREPIALMSKEEARRTLAGRIMWLAAQSSTAISKSKVSE